MTTNNVTAMPVEQKPTKKVKKSKKYIASLTNTKRRTKMAYLFLSPWIIGTICFALIPILMTFLFSFTKITDTIKGYQFEPVGIKNYFNVLVSNVVVIPAILQFIRVELIYVPIILVMSFIMATILIKKLKGKVVFRTIFFLPVIIISGVLVTTIFQVNTDASESMAIKDPITSSFLYRIIASYSESGAELLVEIFSQFVIILWLTGIPIILFINALQKINKNMYEAAKIDGANKWQILWKITVPNIMGIAFVCAVFSIVQISTLPVSDLFNLIIGAIGGNNFALACTYAMIYVVLILLLIGFFALVLIPKEKKEKQYITMTMKRQYEETMKKIEKEKIENGK